MLNAVPVVLNYTAKHHDMYYKKAQKGTVWNHQLFLIFANIIKTEYLTEKKSTETTQYPWASLFIKLTHFSFTAMFKKKLHILMSKNIPSVIRNFFPSMRMPVALQKCIIFYEYYYCFM